MQRLGEIKMKTNDEIISAIEFLKGEMNLPDFSAFGDDNRAFKVLVGDVVETLEKILEDTSYQPRTDLTLPIYKLLTAFRTKDWVDDMKDVYFKDENDEEYFADDLIMI